MSRYFTDEDVTAQHTEDPIRNPDWAPPDPEPEPEPEESAPPAVIALLEPRRPGRTPPTPETAAASAVRLAGAWMRKIVGYAPAWKRTADGSVVAERFGLRLSITYFRRIVTVRVRAGGFDDFFHVLPSYTAKLRAYVAYTVFHAAREQWAAAVADEVVVAEEAAHGLLWGDMDLSAEAEAVLAADDAAETKPAQRWSVEPARNGNRQVAAAH